MSNWHFIEPLDLLSLRGNKLFGDPGSYGESLMPPWPSAVAGAIRSLLLVRDGTDMAAFARGEVEHPDMGTPTSPGAFRVTGFRLARQQNGGVESIHAIPADLVVSKDDSERLHVRRLQPHTLAQGIQSSSQTDQTPILPETQRGKPASGYWLTQQGYADHLAGNTPPAETLLATSDLWQLDERVGVGLEPERRRAADGKLFTIQAVALRHGVGFLAATEGANLPEQGMLRLGGDGRGARMQAVEFSAAGVDLETICKEQRCRILLTSPGLFPQGWRLPGMDENGRFELMGVKGRVAAAAVTRAEVVSGWDLARRQPKPALRAAPTGSIYWIEELVATPEALGKLADHGLWPQQGYDAQRRVEGFNRFDWGM